VINCWRFRDLGSYGPQFVDSLVAYSKIACVICFAWAIRG
jgi:hypothetical protein